MPDDALNRVVDAMLAVVREQVAKNTLIVHAWQLRDAAVAAGHPTLRSAAVLRLEGDGVLMPGPVRPTSHTCTL